MRILVLNPNTSSGMTSKIAEAARRAASAGTEIIARNPAQGPESIEGYYDEAMSLGGLLSVIRAEPDFDAVVLACFDDTGLDAARCLTDKPVIGIGEAAYRMASMLSNKFSVVTTLARSVPALEHNILRYGMHRYCVRVRSSEVAVLELEHANSRARQQISDEIAKAIAEDRAEAIVLGCAGMTDLAQSLAQEFQMPVLDGVACAVVLCEGLVRLGLHTSRHGGYSPPPPGKLQSRQAIDSIPIKHGAAAP